MSSTLKSKIVNGLVLSAVFLAGFITCMTTPLVDKMNLVSAWEQKSTLYLTSSQVKILTNARDAAVDRCSPLLPDEHERAVLRSSQAYHLCMSQQYSRYAGRFQGISVGYRYASCREGPNAEQHCMDVARKPFPEKQQDTPPLPLPFE